MSPLRARAPLRAKPSGEATPQFALETTSERRQFENGRLAMDERASLPEGPVTDVVSGEGDDLSEQGRRALHDALAAFWTSAEACRLRPASAILDELRRRR
jgi:hypothetical protein